MTTKPQADPAIATVIAAITAELRARKLKHTVENLRLGGDQQSVTVIEPHADVYVLIDVKLERRRSWDRDKLAKARVVVGSYGDRRQFPPRKAGFDIKAIVDEVVDRIVRAKQGRANDERLAIKYERLNAAVERLRAATRLARTRVRVDVGPYRHGIDIAIAGIDEADAQAVLAAIAAALPSWCVPTPTDEDA